MESGSLLEVALSPFGYEYMRNAIVGAGVVGAMCALLSCFVVLRGWSLLGDALSHAVVPGVALAALFGLPLLAGAAVAAALAVGGIALVERNAVLKSDAVVGVVFTTFFAAGLLIVSVYPTNLRVTTILLGNLLGIADSDLYQVYGVGILCALVIGPKWRDFIALSFDADHAASIGLNVRLLHATLLCLLSLACVAALQAVGALLVAAMLIAPGATAYLLTDRFGRMLILAPLIGGAGAFAGAYASFFLDGAVGGCIVLLQTALFLLAWLLAPKHGVIARRRRAGNLGGGDAVMLLDFLVEPLRHGFMVKAMLVGAFVCAVCAALSCFIVLKGWSLIGDAISHAVLPGIVLAHLFGVPMALGAVASGILCVQAAGGVSGTSRVKPDAALGILFTGFLALGMVLVTAFPSDIDFTHVLFGNLLGITDSDLTQALILGGLALATALVKRRDLVLFCFDPVQAQVIGLSPRRLEALLLLLVAATAVASLQVVGLALILAMLITPGCVGLLMVKRFDVALAIAMGSAVLSALLGTLASFRLDGATGPCIVLAQALQFVVALMISPRGGLLRRTVPG